MKITQIRENGDTEALSVTDIDLLIEKMKKETKLRPVTGLYGLASPVRTALYRKLRKKPKCFRHMLTGLPLNVISLNFPSTFY